MLHLRQQLINNYNNYAAQYCVSLINYGTKTNKAFGNGKFLDIGLSRYLVQISVNGP